MSQAGTDSLQGGSGAGQGLPGKVGDDGEQKPSAEGWGTDCTSNCYHLRPFLSPAMRAVPARLTTARGAPTLPRRQVHLTCLASAVKPLPGGEKAPTSSQLFLSTGGSYIPTDMGSLLYTAVSLFSPAQV